MRSLKFALISVALGLASVAYAQSSPPPGGPPGGGGEETGGGPRFDAQKARHLQRMQQEMTCVQAATTFEAMRACRPERPERREPPSNGR